MKKENDVTISNWEAVRILNTLMEAENILSTEEKKGNLKDNEYFQFHKKKILKNCQLIMNNLVKKIHDESKLG